MTDRNSSFDDQGKKGEKEEEKLEGTKTFCPPEIFSDHFSSNNHEIAIYELNRT